MKISCPTHHLHSAIKSKLTSVCLNYPQLCAQKLHFPWSRLNKVAAT